MPEVCAMTSLEIGEARVIVAGHCQATALGHDLERDWQRGGATWFNHCAECSRRVVVNPSERRSFGAALRARCPHS